MELVKRFFTIKFWVIAALILLFGGLLWNSQNAFAANPTTINFQGKVVNSNGTNVANGTYPFTFKLYTVSSGGSAIWTETQSAVLVNSGIFQVSLGSVCPFFTANTCNNNTPINFATSSTIYMGITFNNDPAGEMTPRILFQSVPFAYNADQVGGLSVSQLVQLSPALQQSGNININGNGTFGGNLNSTNITASGSLQGGTLTVTGLTTLSGGLTASSINTTAGTNTTLGNATGSFALSSTGLNISSLGNITGVSGISTTGSYTQTGTSANTFTGASTFSAAGIGLTVTNNLTVGGGFILGNYNDILTAQTATTTYNLTTNAGSYYLSSTCTSPNISTTFNLSNVQGIDGEFLVITGENINSTSGGSNTTSTIIQIAGTTVATISSGKGVTNSRSFIVTRQNGVYHVVGEGAVGTISNTSSTTNTADYAEWIDYTGNQPQPGEILVAGPTPVSVSDSRGLYDKSIIGVVSTTPYIVGGVNDGHSVVLALTGRVPVKVTGVNGPINIGDPITSSSIPGVGMLATEPGQIIGKALSSFDGSGEGSVMVQLGVGYDVPSSYSKSLTDSLIMPNGTIIDNGNFVVNQNSTFNGGVSYNLTSPKSNININSDLNSIGSALSIDVNPDQKTSSNASGLTINQSDSSTQGSVNGLQSGLVINNSNNSSKIINAINITSSGTAGYDKLINSNNFVVDSLGNISATSILLNKSLSIKNSDGLVTTNIDSLGNENLAGNFTASSALIKQSLTVGGVASFSNLSIFQKLATFIASAVFNADVTFNGTITVNNNMAGYAILNPGETTVHVSFGTEFSSVPIVSTNIVSGQFDEISVNNVTTKGFDISLLNPASTLTKINWTAILVNNPNTSSNPQVNNSNSVSTTPVSSTSSTQSN